MIRCAGPPEMNRHCPIAQTLEVLGQKWSLLLLREAFRGLSRYAEFQQIGIPRATLGARLDALVHAGLLERRSYREPGERTREEYVLTPAGRDTMPVLAALAEWGEAHLQIDSGASVEFVRASDQVPVRLEFVDAQGLPLERGRVELKRPHAGAPAPATLSERA